jgi:hypothetical protein
MNSDGTQQWQGAAKGGAGMQYYIVAEGNRLAVTSPARASHEFYTVE